MNLTLDEALIAARHLKITDDNPFGRELAVWVLETFGEALPCGMIAPVAIGTHVIVSDETAGRYTQAEARALATATLRAADAAVFVALHNAGEVTIE
jgi:hypothetical protein